MEPACRFKDHQANGCGWLDPQDVAGNRAYRRPSDAGAFASAGVLAMKRTSSHPHRLVPLSWTGWCPVLEG